MSILCIDIGGTAVKFGTYHADGKLIASYPSLPSQDDKGNNIIVDSVFKQLDNILSQEHLDGVALCTAGVVNPESGEIVFSGPTIPDYQGTNWKELITNQYNLPVEVENDVNAACLGEKWLGSLRGINNGVCLTIGTGIGGAILINGEIFHGENFAAGEVGYQDLGQGNFQELASTSALIRQIQKETRLKLTGEEIFHQAQAGEVLYQEAISEMVTNLVRGILNIIYFLSPEKIVLGGGIMAQKEIIKPLLSKALIKFSQANYFLQTEIDFAELGNKAGMLGALYHFNNKQGWNKNGYS